MAGGDTDPRQPRSAIDVLQRAPIIRDALEVGDLGDRANARAGRNHIELGPEAGMADLHAGFAKMAVVEDYDAEIARLLRRNRQQAADAHQLLALAGDA